MTSFASGALRFAIDAFFGRFWRCFMAYWFVSLKKTWTSVG